MKDVEILLILVRIMNCGIDYDITQGNHAQVLAKQKAREKIMNQILARKAQS